MMQHNMVLAVATFPLAGALLAFLCYNFNPATIFLGDSGSSADRLSVGLLRRHLEQ
jgi:UDP-GlcNAc:undecaprenyl-phosphate/decaprenyl-phosphate GlcNAc-1-phosphate transferase